MQKKKNIIVFFVVCLGLCHADCESLFGDIPSQFNTWMRGDFSCKNSDTEGRLAAGGCIDIQSYGVGCKIREPPQGQNCIPFGSVSCQDLRGDDEMEYSVVAGSDLTMKNSMLFTGGVAYAGKFEQDGVTIGGDCGKDRCQNIDFEYWHNVLKGISRDLTNLATTGLTEVSEDGAVTLKGRGCDDLEVFYVCGCALEEATSLTLKDVKPGATVIIQVNGKDMHIGEFEFNGFDCENVLFNFYEATKLIFCDIYWKGSVLAPLADFEDSTGVIDGQIFGKSWRTSRSTCMQQNFCKFKGHVPERTTRETRPHSPSRETKDHTHRHSDNPSQETKTSPHSPSQETKPNHGGGNNDGGKGDNNGGGKGDNNGNQGPNNGGNNQDPASTDSARVSQGTPIVALPIADGESVVKGSVQGSGLSVGAIVGIAVGSFAFVALTAGLVTAFVLWKKGMLLQKAGSVAIAMPDVPAT